MAGSGDIRNDCVLLLFVVRRLLHIATIMYLNLLLYVRPSRVWFQGT